MLGKPLTKVYYLTTRLSSFTFFDFLSPRIIFFVLRQSDSNDEAREEPERNRGREEGTSDMGHVLMKTIHRPQPCPRGARPEREEGEGVEFYIFYTMGRYTFHF